MKKAYWRSARFTPFLVAAALALGACSGSSTPNAASSPTVASLGSSSNHTGGGNGGGGSTTTAPKGGDATQLMNEWTTCMRANGDPDQTDPTIDQYGVINITMTGVTQSLLAGAHGSGGPCSQYELAAENDLRADNPVAPPATQGQLVQYADCMRTHGVSNYPDPGPNDETNFNGTGVDPNSPSFENANKVCGMNLNFPAWWIAGTGPPGDVVVSSCDGSASFCSGPPPSGANRRRGAGGNGGSGANG